MLTLKVISENYLSLKVVPLNVLSQNTVQTQAPRKRITKYTLRIFLERAKEIHGEKYNYSDVTEDHIKGKKSHIPITCNDCEYKWCPSIDGHINSKRGCPGCAGNIPWTLERFLAKAKEIHGDKYDYSQIREENIKGKESNIPVKCNECTYEWNPTIHNHINGKTGCPDCGGQSIWTLEKFLIKARKIHGDKYDYSHITIDDINNCDSRVDICCNECGYSWNSAVKTHINCRSACPDCGGKVPWTLERFLLKAKQVHGDKYDYSQITQEHINGHRSCIPIMCLKCSHSWNPAICDHVNGKTGCRHCSVSRGYSDVQIRWLNNIMEKESIYIRHALSAEGEYKIPGLGKVDGYCSQTNTVYEFHGDYWHGNPDIYDATSVNMVNHKTFGELYNKTLERDQKIRDKGYNLIVMWESDFKNK